MNKIEEVKVSKRQQTISAEDKKCLIPIFVSTNYDKFLLMDSNRLLKAGKIARLKEEIERRDLTYENEIKVRLSDDGKNLIVLEGQHRFKVCCDMGLPIFYRFSIMDTKDIGLFNSVQDKWSLEDSLHHYCVEGRHDYKILAGFRKQYKYPISTLIHVLSGRNDKTMLNEFRRGHFTVTQGLEFVHSLLSKIQQFKPFNDRIYRHRTFLKVYMDLMTHPEFEHEKMLHKVEQVPMRFIYCTKVNDYLRMIEDVYNWNNKTKQIKLY